MSDFNVVRNVAAVINVSRLVLLKISNTDRRTRGVDQEEYHNGKSPNKTGHNYLHNLFI